GQGISLSAKARSSAQRSVLPLMPPSKFFQPKLRDLNVGGFQLARVAFIPLSTNWPSSLITILRMPAALVNSHCTQTQRPVGHLSVESTEVSPGWWTDMMWPSGEEE